MMLRDILQRIREILGWMSPVLNTKINFLIKKKRLPNLNNPKTFDDKITWLKLNDYPENELVIQCTDKYEVRKYIASMGHTDILNELLGVWESPLDIDFQSLPESFVLKWNNDYNSTFVIKDKNSADLNSIVKKLHRKGKQKFYYRASELHYKAIKPLVIAEKLLIEPGKEELTDYKLYCYDGVVEYIMVCLGRETETKFYFFDRNWNFLRINNDGKKEDDNFTLEKPKSMDQAIKIAEEISKPFSFVRADFYIIDDKVIFGELTFTPASGMDPNLDEKLDTFFGKHLKIEEIK